MNITFLANAGLLIDTGEHRLLIDALYSDTGHVFSAVPTDAEQRLMSGEGEFADIDYLLFTHQHPDHFDIYKTRDYLLKHEDCSAILPSTCISETDELMGDAKRVKRLSLKNGEAERTIIDENTELTAFAAGHIGEQYKDIINICYLVKAGGKSVLITGDADCEPYYFNCIITEKPDAVVVNPLFFQSKQGAEIVTALSPKRLIIYHIPSEEQDAFNLRRMVLHQAERHKDEGYVITPMLNSLQSIAF